MEKNVKGFIKVIYVLFFFCSATFVWGDESSIRVITEDREYSFNVMGRESLAEILERIKIDTGKEAQEFLIAFSNEEDTQKIKSHLVKTRGKDLDRSCDNKSRSYSQPRDYYIQATPQQKQALRYMMLTLSQKSLISLALARNELEHAGDQIEGLHPLSLMLAIFMDEELKVAIKNMRSRGVVWNNFIAGIKGSFAGEYALGNIADEQLRHFASQVKISLALIQPAVHNQDWERFVDLLIYHVPRTGGSSRYDF